MSKIQTKPFCFGNSQEAEWPPRFPEKQEGFVGYWDKEKQEFVEGYPKNPNNHFGDAPMVMFDSMEPRFHEGACRTIESKKEWELENKAHNMLTFSSRDEVSRHTKKGISDEKKERRKDQRKAARAALESWRSKPREMKQKLVKQGEQQMETLKKSGVNLSESGINIKD